MSDTPMVRDEGAEAGFREGEIPFPAEAMADGPHRLRPIGVVRSSSTERGRCPKNVRQAREVGAAGRLEIAAPFRMALDGLEPGQWVFLLTWLHRAERDLALQKPKHKTQPVGTFALRSPVRPNPIGLHLVRLISIDTATGIIGIDAVDVLDRTPLLDIKPHLPSVDAPPPGSD